MHKPISVVIAALLNPVGTAIRLYQWLARMDPAARCFLVLLAALGWSSGGFLVKSVRYEPYAALALRGLIYAWVMIIYQTWTLRKRRRQEEQNTSWLGAAGYVSKNVLWCKDPWHYVCGVFGASNLTLSTWAILLTVGGMSTFLNSGAVLVLAVVDRLVFKKRLNRQTMAAVALGSLGIGALGVGGFMNGESDGMLLGSLSLAIFSVFLIASGRRAEGKRGTEIMESWTLSGLLPGIVFFPCVLKAGIPDFMDVVWIVIMGMLSSGVSDILYTRAVSGAADKLDMLPAYLISRISPVLTPVWIGIVHKELPAVSSIAGGVCVMIAVFWQLILSKQKSPTST